MWDKEFLVRCSEQIQQMYVVADHPGASHAAYLTMTEKWGAVLGLGKDHFLPSPYSATFQVNRENSWN